MVKALQALFVPSDVVADAMMTDAVWRDDGPIRFFPLIPDYATNSWCYSMRDFNHQNF